MANDDNQQYYITIPNSNGETIIITPEILPEQLLPLVQKKQFKEEKVDLSNLTSAYKKIIENLTENGSNSLGSISSLSNIISVNSGNSSRIKQSSSNSEHHKIRDNLLYSSSSSLVSARSSLPTILLRPTNRNQNNNNNNNNLQSSVPNEHSLISGSIADNSNNYITTLQISQSNSNLPTLAFTQPQALLHYSNQNPASPNTVLIPISLHNSNQFSQQQILVAAAAVASGGYNQNCNNDGCIQSIQTSNSGSHHNLNTTSLAKLISGNLVNPLSINLGNVMKSNSANSDISPDSKSSTHKRKFDMNPTDEFGRRKEMRLLKNREAARECRRKKKEYVKCLENRVTNLEQQNKVLVDEINRMKELYSKKPTKKGSNAPSDVDLKYAEVYPADNLIKEYYDSVNSNDCDQPQQQMMHKDKSYVNHIMAMNNTTNDTHTKYGTKDNVHVTTSTSATNIVTNKDGTCTQLSDLLVSNHNTKKPFNNNNNNNTSFHSNTSIFPNFRNETDAKEAEEEDDDDDEEEEDDDDIDSSGHVI